MSHLQCEVDELRRVARVSAEDLVDVVASPESETSPTSIALKQVTGDIEALLPSEDKLAYLSLQVRL